MPFAPSDISGLKGWWDASAITGLTDGNSVSSWSDLSGNSRTLTPLASNPPTYKTGIKNGLPVVRFDGVNDVIEAASVLPGSTSYTVFIVFSATSMTNYRAPFQAGGNFALAGILNSAAARGIYAPGSFATFTGGTYTPGTWERWAIPVSSGGGTTIMYVDNVSKMTVGACGAGGAFRLGSARNTGSTAGEFYAEMDVAEVLVYDTALSSTDRGNVDTYLYNKWFASAATTGTAAASLPALTGSAAGTVALPASSGTVAATLPSLSAAAAGTYTPPVTTGAVAAALPALTGFVAGTHTSNDQVGAVAVTLPALTGSVDGTFAPAPVTGDVAATLPALTGAADGSIVNPTTGTVTATLPALTALIEDRTDADGTVAATLPSLTGSIVASVPTSVVGPWTADVSRRTLLPFVTSGIATSSPPLPVVPPGITERPIMRSSRVVPALPTIVGAVVDAANQPRIPDHIYDALPETVEEIGVPHIIFRNHSGAVDVTYMRGRQSQLLRDRREEPFGDTTFSFELPSMSSMDEWPDEDGMPLRFLINRANVQIELVKSDGSRRVVWTGFIVSHNTGNSESEPSKTIECVGTMFQAATDRMKPPPFLDPTDIGTLMSKALNTVSNRRYPVLTAPATGIMSRQRGSWADSPLAYVQGLLATAWTEDGRQWTVAKVKDSTRTYEIRLKKTAPEWTVTNGARGVSVDLSRDEASIRNVIYGHGVGPDGNTWYNYHYPNLHADDAPAYPFASPSSVISVGTTDADTTSGSGVTDWQRRARELGYRLAVDGVFNTSDATVARTIQRRFGASVDGVVGPQTWTATFAVGSNGGDLSGVIRLPLAADPRTQKALYNADGSVAGPNPEWDTNVLTYADDVDFGTGITRAEGIASAQQIIDREAEAGLAGRIVLTQDPREGWRGDIAPGDKMTLIGYEGADRVLHITAVERDWQTMTVTLDVDEKSRDAMTIAQIRSRDKEARRDPARRPGNPNKRSRLDTDQVVPFDGESGAGVIPRLALYGGLWSVIRIPVSETGRVAKMHLEAGSPFAIAFFGAPITPAHLHSYVGNPLTSDAPFEPHEKELDAHWFIEGFGQKGQRCGYYPGAEDRSTPFTGVEEQGGFEYTSSRAPWVWVAMYAASSCFLEGYIYPDTVV